MTTGVPLGVCVLPPPGPNCARTVSYPGVVLDTLDHYGLPYDTVEVADLASMLGRLRVLVTVGDAALDSTTRKALRAWVESGGAWVAVAGTAGLADLLGVTVDAPALASWGGGVGTLGEGYATPRTGHPVTGCADAPMHYYNGIPVRPLDCVSVLADASDVHRRSTGRVAVTEAVRGSGRCVLIAPDLPGAIVRIRQGIAITRDGVPSGDGTAPICDDVLKSGDGFALDWEFDRREVPGVPGFRAFLDAQADQWAELLVRAVLHAALGANVRLPMLWLYPRGLPAIGVLSHDSDGNDPASARAMLKAVAGCGICSTWCVMVPGYPEDVIAAIRAAGHELAMHYDAMSEGAEWSEAAFASQHAALAAGLGPLTTNKNHYLRWEGDCELYTWCAAHGIRLDQSKGASKTGEAGYNFGTCHPHFPVLRDGTALPVYELTTPTQDLIVFAPPPLAAALTDTVVRRHGVLHLLFHPAHIEKPGVAEAMVEAVGRARERGLEWWTAGRLADWEDSRRGVRWSQYRRDSSAARITLVAARALEDPVVLWLDPAGRETRFGFPFTAQSVRLDPENPAVLELTT
jgi:hypothetical protein